MDETTLALRPLVASRAEPRLTVVQVLPALRGGGVERGTVELAQALVRAGHRSIVISAGGPMRGELLARGSEHLRWPIGRKSPWTLRLVPRLRRLLERERVDILHARSRMPAWVAYLAWRSLPAARRPRFVTSVHGLYSKAGWYSAVMARGERVIAVSDTVHDYLRRHYPQLDPARVHVIHHGVDRRRFPYRFRPADAWLTQWYRTYPGLERKHVITLPGRLTRGKGHRDFLAIMARLHARGLPAHGMIVGGEEPRRHRYAEGLRAEAARRQLPVTFVAHTDRLREIYAVSDIVASLSRHPESFGRTVLEALSIGTPVVGYDHGGVGEILRHVFPQGRVPAGSVREAAERIAEFIQRPPRVPPSEAYPLERTLERTLALYTELAGAARRG